MLRRAFFFLAASCLAWTAPARLNFPVRGYTNYGDWSGEVSVSQAAWGPGDSIAIDSTLQVSAQHLQNLSAAGIKADSYILLVTAERTFDFGGRLRLPYDM